VVIIYVASRSGQSRITVRTVEKRRVEGLTGRVNNLSNTFLTTTLAEK
jgi:hypothetical protein